MLGHHSEIPGQNPVPDPPRGDHGGPKHYNISALHG